MAISQGLGPDLPAAGTGTRTWASMPSRSAGPRASERGGTVDVGPDLSGRGHQTADVGLDAEPDLPARGHQGTGRASTRVRTPEQSPLQPLPATAPRDCRSGTAYAILPLRPESGSCLAAPVAECTDQEGEQTISRDLRVNQMIRIPQVRVVDEEGAQLGVMPTPRALEMAQERGLDLVEVAPMAAPPVVKFLDFGQYKYDLTKREKEAKRKQRSVTFKEVRLSPKIGTGDFDTKVHRAIEFLEDGDRIKVTVRFRGRELTHPELGRNLIARFVDRVKEHGVAERTPLLEGKSMHITMASLHKPKTHDAPAPRGAEAGEPKTEAAPTTAAETQPTTAAETTPTTAAETAPTTAPKPVAAETAPTTVTQPKTRTEPKTQPEPAPPPAEAPVAADVRPPAAKAPVAARVAESRSEPKQSTPAPEPVTSGE